MSILSDIISKNVKKIVEVQQQPKFPLKYSSIYGPWTPITEMEMSYQQNFFNLLLTNPGEWPMDPGLGIGLRTYLFELEESLMFANLKPTIISQLRKYLPEIELVDVIFNKNAAQIDRNLMNIVIVYSIFGSVVYTTSASQVSMGSTDIKFEDINRRQYQPLDIIARSGHLISSEKEI